MPAALSSEFGGVIEQMAGAQVQRLLSLQNPHIPSPQFGTATTDWMKNCVNEFDRMATLANQRLFREEHPKSEA
jgi:hypothetical protein